MIKKKLSLISFFAITGIAFHSGCSKFNNYGNKSASDFNNLSISNSSKENSNLETSINDALSKDIENSFKVYQDSFTEGEKIDYLTKTYKRYLVQIQKKDNKLYLTSNLNNQNKVFHSINELNRELQKEIFNKNTENIRGCPT
ncbi:hypothetical protein [Silvanigrella sp.]|jgi:hypothetical protein|uniref:hypothetical protein n=1 Tax=Silvanigrella sp. TaxID=2024976 RepID=UPI0037C7B496|nr:hypothetical protein [Silvanigrellaceae bacterium]